MKKVWVFDIDGTLADNDHRMHYLNGKKNWDAFFAEQHKDEPYQAVLDVLHSLVFDGHKVIVVTAREERFREDTLDWLNKHIEYNFPSEDLYMRPIGNRGDDDKMKVDIVKNWIAANSGYKVGGIFEDRHRIIDAFRSEGWYVFEANQTRTQF